MLKLLISRLQDDAEKKITGELTMPVMYETTAQIAENGHLLIDLDDLPFAKGTQFLVKLIPQFQFDVERFQAQMENLMDECARHNPFEGKSNAAIAQELRRQREEMFHESA